MTDPKNMEVVFGSKQLDFAEKSKKFGHLILVADGIGLNPIPTATHTRVQVNGLNDRPKEHGSRVW